MSKSISLDNGLFFKILDVALTVDSSSFKRLTDNKGISQTLTNVYSSGADSSVLHRTRTEKKSGGRSQSQTFIYPVIDPRTEYAIVGAPGGCGDFLLDEKVTQYNSKTGKVMEGYVCTWVADGASYGAGNTASESLDRVVVDYSNLVYGPSFPLLGIHMVGTTNPSDGSGPTGPIGGYGISTDWPPIVGQSSGAQWDIAPLTHQATAGHPGPYPQYLLTSTHANNLVAVYKENLHGASTGVNYGFTPAGPVPFSDGGTEAAPAAGADTSASMLVTMDEIIANHRIFGPGDPGYIATTTITDYYGAGWTLDAATGGSGSGTNTSEFSEVLGRLLVHESGRGISVQYIRDLAFDKVSASATIIGTADLDDEDGTDFILTNTDGSTVGFHTDPTKNFGDTSDDDGDHRWIINTRDIEGGSEVRKATQAIHIACLTAIAAGELDMTAVPATDTGTQTSFTLTQTAGGAASNTTITLVTGIGANGETAFTGGSGYDSVNKLNTIDITPYS
jgi:hypothetical protein